MSNSEVSFENYKHMYTALTSFVIQCLSCIKNTNLEIEINKIEI